MTLEKSYGFPLPGGEDKKSLELNNLLRLCIAASVMIGSGILNQVHRMNALPETIREDLERRLVASNAKFIDIGESSKHFLRMISIHKRLIMAGRLLMNCFINEK